MPQGTIEKEIHIRQIGGEENGYYTYELWRWDHQINRRISSTKKGNHLKEETLRMAENDFGLKPGGYEIVTEIRDTTRRSKKS